MFVQLNCLSWGLNLVAVMALGYDLWVPDHPVHINTLLSLQVGDTEHTNPQLCLVWLRGCLCPVLSPH